MILLVALVTLAFAITVALVRGFLWLTSDLEDHDDYGY